MNRKIALVMALSLLNPVLVMAASFDCAKAQTIVENSICEDEKLGKLDEMLSANYKAVMTVAKATDAGSVEKVKTDQKEWIQERDQCTDINCITSVYVDRVNGICERAMISGLDVENCTKFYPDEVEEQPVQQATELPLEIQYRNGELYFTAIVDNVTINKVAINRGNCKTLDYKRERDQTLAHYAKYPNLQKGGAYLATINTGVLKYGQTYHSSAGYNCVPRELVVDTDRGSWNVTLTLTSN